jgi:hypothetical protein
MHTYAATFSLPWSQSFWFRLARNERPQLIVRDRRPGWFWRTEEGRAHLLSIDGSSMLAEQTGDQREED